MKITRILASYAALAAENKAYREAMEIVQRSKALILPKGLVREEYRDEVAALSSMYQKVDKALAPQAPDKKEGE